MPEAGLKERCGSMQENLFPIDGSMYADAKKMMSI